MSRVMSYNSALLHSVLNVQVTTQAFQSWIVYLMSFEGDHPPQPHDPHTHTSKQLMMMITEGKVPTHMTI